jgi:hypothetical protein
VRQRWHLLTIEIRKYSDPFGSGIPFGDESFNLLDFDFKKTSSRRETWFFSTTD